MWLCITDRSLRKFKIKVKPPAFYKTPLTSKNRSHREVEHTEFKSPAEYLKQKEIKKLVRHLPFNHLRVKKNKNLRKAFRIAIRS